ncbi:MAG: PucR family transcriptional regulator [Propionibacteriaceae bacterium]
MLLPFGADPETGDPSAERIMFEEPCDRADYAGAIVLITARIPHRLALATLIEHTERAAALVLPPSARPEVLLPDRGGTSAGEGPRLLRRSPWVDWSELFQALHRLLEVGPTEPPLRQLNHLDALARWISDQSGEPVTVEDLDSRVLAYAVGGKEVDSIRRQTILSGEVPAWRIERLMSSGFLPAVWRSDDVVIRDAEGIDPARMAVALKAGTETIGTIWAAMGENADREKLRRLLLSVRKSASTMLLRETNRDRYEWSMQQSALADLLSSGVDPGVPAALLGLERTAVHFVLALGKDTAVSRDLLFHIQALRTGTMVVRVRSELFAIMPLEEDTDPDQQAAGLERDLQRVTRGRDHGLIAVGSPALDLAALRESADLARRVLRVAHLQWVPVRRVARGPTVLMGRDAEEALVLLRAVELLSPAADEIMAPLDALELHDAHHGTRLVETIAAVVEHPKNLADAARELGVHANSLRYRLERIADITRTDPRSAMTRTRFALGLLLRDLDRLSGDSTPAIASEPRELTG